MPAGRPTKYKKEFNEQAEGLALLGLTDKEIAKFFKIDEKTLNTWKHKHVEFLQSLTRGKTQADIPVVKSLRKRALGYDYKETTIVRKAIVQEGEDAHDSQLEQVEIRETTKHLAPDVPAQLSWLSNRQRGKWSKNPTEKDSTLEDFSFKVTFE